MDIGDMIQSAIDRQPNRFREAFADVMSAKVVAAIADKRVEVAQNYFNPPQAESEENE